MCFEYMYFNSELDNIYIYILMTEFYEFPNEKSFPLKADHLDCMFTLM